MTKHCEEIEKLVGFGNELRNERKGENCNLGTKSETFIFNKHDAIAE